MANKKKNTIPFEYKKKGKGKRVCRLTHNARAVLRQYGLQLGRRTFREIADKIGFRKY